MVRRFAANPEVETYQQYSYKIAREFPDGYFDYVYVDGNHTYEYVLQDLIDFSAKLKPDGVLMGHDFCEDAHAAQYRYGIIDAVRRFLARSRDFRFFCLTHELFPSFALVRSDSGFAGQFIRNLLESDVFLVELGDEQAFRYEEKSVVRSDGSVRRIPSFTL